MWNQTYCIVFSKGNSTQRSACLTNVNPAENATYISSENSPPNYRFCLFYRIATCSFEALVIVSSTLAMVEIVYQQGTNCERTSKLVEFHQIMQIIFLMQQMVLVA